MHCVFHQQDKNDSEERMQVLLQQLKDVRRQYKEIMVFMVSSLVYILFVGLDVSYLQVFLSYDCYVF